MLDAVEELLLFTAELDVLVFAQHEVYLRDILETDGFIQVMFVGGFTPLEALAILNNNLDNPNIGTPIN